jgi:hypothetical protein
MADQDRPNQNANKEKAEGGRRETEQHSGRNADRDEHPERQYPKDDTDAAGGITNRPLSDEVENQEHLPERGTKRDRAGHPDSSRRDGDYEEDRV